MQHPLIRIAALCFLLLFGQTSALGSVPPQTTSPEQSAEHKRLRYEAGATVAGLAMGALAAGPLGALAGSLAGTWFGKVMYRASTASELQTALQEQQERNERQRLANSRLAEQNLVLASKVDAASQQLAATHAERTLP